MICTQWQPSYTPNPRPVDDPEKALKLQKPRKTPRVRGALFIYPVRSKVAKRILSAVEMHSGATAMEVIKLAETSSAHQYLKLLEQYGCVESKRIHCEKTGMHIKHYTRRNQA